MFCKTQTIFEFVSFYQQAKLKRTHTRRECQIQGWRNLMLRSVVWR